MASFLLVTRCVGLAWKWKASMHSNVVARSNPDLGLMVRQRNVCVVQTTAAKTVGFGQRSQALQIESIKGREGKVKSRAEARDGQRGHHRPCAMLEVEEELSEGSSWVPPFRLSNRQDTCRYNGRGHFGHPPPQAPTEQRGGRLGRLQLQT